MERHGTKNAVSVLEKIYGYREVDAPHDACKIASNCEHFLLEFLSQNNAELFQAGCPNECSRNGLCLRGKCLCPHGFDGEDCAVSKSIVARPSSMKCDKTWYTIRQMWKILFFKWRLYQWKM
jgi:hypothetical protein